MTYATIWNEKVESRQPQIGLSDPSAKLVLYGLQAYPYDDDADANLSLLNALPLVYPGFLYANLTFKSYQVKNVGGGLWEAEATYSRQDPLYSFDIGGGTQKVTQALAQRGVYGVSGARTARMVRASNGSNSVTVLGVDTTDGLLTGYVVKDSQGAFAGGTVISSVTSPTVLALSNAATRSTGDPRTLTCRYDAGNNTLTVLPTVLHVTCALAAGSVDAVILGGGDTTQLDVGAPVAGPAGAIALGTTVATVVDDSNFTLSIPALVTGNVTLDITSGNNTSVLSGRVDMYAHGPGIPAGSQVSSIPSTTSVVLAAAPTRGSGLFGNPVTFSEEEILYFAPPTGAPPDFAGAINVKQDLSVEGVDVPVPSGHFELTYHVNPAIITQDYANTLELAVGVVNSTPFLGRDVGTVQYLGARGSQKGAEDFEITFRFARSPNRVNFKVGDIPVPLKYGWDYMWVSYGQARDAGSPNMVAHPQWVVVDQVSPMTSFDFLGIG